MVTKRLLRTYASTAKQDQPPRNSTAEEWLPSTVLGRASQQNTRGPQYILLITVNNICVLVIIINNHRSVSIKALKWLNYNKYDIKLGENTNEWWLMNWNNYKKPSQNHWGGSESRKTYINLDAAKIALGLLELWLLLQRFARTFCGPSLRLFQVLLWSQCVTGCYNDFRSYNLTIQLHNCWNQLNTNSHLLSHNTHKEWQY